MQPVVEKMRAENSLNHEAKDCHKYILNRDVWSTAAFHEFLDKVSSYEQVNFMQCRFGDVFDQDLPTLDTRTRTKYAE